MSGTSYLTGLVKHSRLPINRRSIFRGETGGAETVQSPQMGQASPVSQASDLRPQLPIENVSARSASIEDRTFSPNSPIPQTSKPRLNLSQRHRVQDAPKQNDVRDNVQSQAQTHRVDAQDVYELEIRKKPSSNISSSETVQDPSKTSHVQHAQLDSKNTIETGPDIEAKASPAQPKSPRGEKGGDITRQTIKEKLQDKSNGLIHQGERDAPETQHKKSVSAKDVRLRQARRSEPRSMPTDPAAKYKGKNNGVHIGTVNVTVSAPPKTPPPAPIINRISKPAPKALPELNRSYQRRF